MGSIKINFMEKYEKSIEECTNKINKIFEVALDESDTYVCIKLYSLDIKDNHSFFNKQPNIQATIERFGRNKIMKIQDIDVIDKNVGNGSILLSHLIEYCKNIGVSNIKGDISIVDKNHFSRLKHFYSKFNFDVEIGNNAGSINLDLKDCKR